MHLRPRDIKAIANDMQGRPEDLTGHDRERREAIERCGIKLLDDWEDYMDSEEAEENAVRDVLLGVSMGFDTARGQVPA